MYFCKCFLILKSSPEAVQLYCREQNGFQDISLEGVRGVPITNSVRTHNVANSEAQIIAFPV